MKAHCHFNGTLQKVISANVKSMKRRSYLLTFLAVLTLSNLFNFQSVNAQAVAPVSGDIVFTACNMTTNDAFEFITLKRLNLNGLSFSDNPVNSTHNGFFNQNEGYYTI